MMRLNYSFKYWLIKLEINRHIPINVPDPIIENI